MLKAYRATSINEDFRHYHVLLAIVNGVRSPREVRDQASLIGMIHPPKYRHGIIAYQYFIENFSDYLDVYFHEYGRPTADTVKNYSDKILLEYSRSKKYESRKGLERSAIRGLNKFQLISQNWDNHLFYYEPLNKLYSKEEVLNAYDFKTGKVQLGINTFVELPKELRGVER